MEGGKFGTPLYAAPEQLKGCCDFKSDMFSLGLILIELLTIFSTEMERVKVLTKARSGELPSSIPIEFVPIIKDLISHKTSKRPNPTELISKLQNLNYKSFNELEIQSKGVVVEVEAVENIFETHVENDIKTLCIEDRQKIIRDKEREIIELRKILAQKENEIAELKNMVTIQKT